jgi:transposase
MKLTIIGMDIAKQVFQLHSLDPQSGQVERFKLKRAQVLEFFAKRAPSIVVMEACGSAHDWARRLQALGHEAKLISARSVRPFVLRNKTDAADARAIGTAAQQPEARFVAVKSEAQQTVLAIHRVRAQLMKFRIMQTNALRGLLYEFGEVLPESYRAFSKAFPAALARAAERLPAMLIDSLREQWARAQDIDREMTVLDRRLANLFRHNPDCQKVADIPGVGLLTGNSDCRSYRRRTHVQIRPRVRRMAGARAATIWHRRTGPADGSEQARRHLFTHAIDAWCPLGDHARQAISLG